MSAVDAGAVGRPVEQAHDPFADQEVAAAPAFLDQPGQGLEAHRPRVDIVGGATGGGGVEGGVDIVRPDLERADLQSPRRRRAARMPSVSVVLPAPEAGAAMMIAGVLMALLSAAGCW